MRRKNFLLQLRAHVIHFNRLNSTKQGIIEGSLHVLGEHEKEIMNMKHKNRERSGNGRNLPYRNGRKYDWAEKKWDAPNELNDRGKLIS